MWTELRYCSEGDYIKAWFLGNKDPEDYHDHNWHRIFKLERKGNGRYYVAIEGWRGAEVSGTEDVYKRND